MARTALLRKTLRLLRASIQAENLGLSDGELVRAAARSDERRYYSRRELLKHSLVAAAALPLSGALLRQTRADGKPKALHELTGAEPIIIVGAGLAGLVAAYRLQNAGQPVELYEGAGRLGGRVLTKDRFNKDGMFCELGGELIDTGHKDVQLLARELGVGIQDLRPFDAGVEHDIFHFGGKVYTQKEMLPAFRQLARHLARDIKAVFPAGGAHMVTFDDKRVAREAAVRLDRLSLGEYLDSKTDVDRWVRDAVEILYVCEYGLDAREQSALNLLVLIEPDQTAAEFDLLGDSDECLRIEGGNSRLVERLEKRVRAHAPPINLRHRLTRLEDKAGQLVLTFDTPEGAKIVRSRRVILGVPFATLRKVEGIGELALSPLKKKCIAELGYGMNTKFMVGFQGRPWRKGPPASRANIVTDALDQSFWETSKGQHGASGIITNYLGGSRALDGRGLESRLTTVLGELDSIYPGLKATHDGNVALFDWGHNPLNLGSYVCPRPGQYTTLWGAAAAPELGGRLLFTGEHTSADGAGFINGAVQSGNQVAAQVLGATRSLRASHQ